MPEIQDLRPALWDAANTLRGSAVDRTDWKGYILPLLFFKRISDVWDEETATAEEAYGDVDPSTQAAGQVIVNAILDMVALPAAG